MNTFTKPNLDIIRADVNKALASVAKAHGITLDIGNIRFSEEQFTTKLTGTASATADGAARLNFERFASKFGIRPDSFGKTFDSRDQKFTIVGIKERSHKYPIIAESSKGGTFKLPLKMIPGKLLTHVI